jgi:predicted ATPase/DNA-binding SARP family transcriptional activator
VELRALGPLELVGDDGLVVDIGGSKPKALLALLAIRPGEVVPAEQIIEQLWGEQQARDPLNALQAIVSKVRRAMQPAEVLVTRTPGYLLDLDPESIDLVRFERRAAEGRRLLEAGDPEGAASALQDALDLWRGEALVDFVYESFAQNARLRLEELRIATLEDRIDAELALGRHESLTGELEALVALHPLRERLQAQLLVALYRSGRQADALRAYQSARAVLGDELGLEPGPELRRVEAAILAQDPSLDLVPAAVARPARAGNLRPSLSSFVGRAGDVERAAALVERHRLVTLVGPGGVGKTRLAIEIGRASSSPAWLIELAAVSDPEALASSVATALGLDDGVPVDQFLAGREVLLLLDNCEHVIDGAARLAEQLVGAGTGVSVLATSRELLGARGEAVFTVPPLAPDDAAALFAERAAERADVEGAPRLVQEICARLDGLPLALELAAARTRTLALDDIVARLDDRFRLLTGGDRTAEPRQQTLRGVVDWSHDLLFAEEQAVFRRLSVFAGGFGLDGAEAVCAGDDVPVEDVIDLVARLVEKSLVTRVPSDRGSRYRLLDTIVDYGRNRLAEAGELDATRRRHLAWIVELSSAAELALRGPDQVGWAARMADEQHNVRTAIEWAISTGCAEEALTIAASIAYAWYLAGQVHEGHALLSEAVALDGATSIDRRCTAHAWIGWFGQHGASSLADAVEHIDLAVELGRGGSVRPFVVAAVFSAILRLDRGDSTGAMLLEEAHARLDAEPDRWASAMLDWARGTYALHLGEIDEAVRLLRESIAGYEAEGDALGRVLGASGLGDLALNVGRYDEAVELITMAYEAITSTRTRAFQAAVLAASLGHIATLQERYEAADEWHQRAMAWATDGGFPRAAAQTLNSMGLAARRQGRFAEATRLHREALAVLAQIGPVSGDALALSSLGTLAQIEGDLDGAAALHFEAFAAARRSDASRPMALAIEGLAGVEAARGHGDVATVLLGAADALRDRSASQLHGAEREDVELAVERATASIGAAAVAASRARGARTVASVIDILSRGDLPAG